MLLITIPRAAIHAMTPPCTFSGFKSLVKDSTPKIPMAINNITALARAANTVVFLNPYV
jgi:hypothetical protein